MSRPNSPRFVYLDSCVLITHLRGKHDILTPLMSQIASGKATGVISTIHYVEVIGKDRPGSTIGDDTESRTLDFLERTGLLMVDVGPDVQLIARKYVREQGLQGCDAMHLAAAVVAGCQALMTYDQKFYKKFGESGLVEGVWVGEPYLLGPYQPSIGEP